ncbi:MAG: hypothetical protein KC492_18640, partial [Myxococcales bacterium]|nr:hypothetical protein [Myxococcales bacterium]
MSDWLRDTRALLAHLSESLLGYPPGLNEVLEPEHQEADDLTAIYSRCGGASLPDVWNGYFIDTPARARTASARAEPLSIDGERAISVFGSDGGGGRFAIARDTGAVLYLPSGGAVSKSTYWQDERNEVREVASSG